jgi:perosamine synthetase
MLAHGVGPGDEVIVPSLTYIATANAVRYTGAEPVFVDVDPATWCLDAEALGEAISPRTRGIVAVHLYGHPADMDALSAVADAAGLWIVEDAAEAHGATYRGRPVGGLASVGVFSFYGNKVITSGEGGALTVNDPAMEERIRLLRGQGMDPAQRYFFPIIGYNYRLTNVACAILCAQLERFEELVSWRRVLLEGYRDRLSGIPGLGFQPVAAWAEPTPWLVSITVDPNAYGRSRDELATILDSAGVETRPFFRPIHSLPPYMDRSGAGRPLPVTDELASRGMNLPTSRLVTDRWLDRIEATIRSASRSRA